MKDTFRGDNAQLVGSIEALLELDAEGALRPHGVGGHARGLLASAAVRLTPIPNGLHKHSGKINKLRIGKLLLMLVVAEDPARKPLFRTWDAEIANSDGTIDRRWLAIGALSLRNDKFRTHYLMLGPLWLCAAWIG